MSDELLIAELRARLSEAQETLDAIRHGEVDAVVVGGPSGTRVYTLENADRPYRVLIEKMQEGAVTLSSEGTILYCNQKFARMVTTDREEILGQGIERFLPGGKRDAFERFLETGESGGLELTLDAREGKRVPVLMSLAHVSVTDDTPTVICAIFTDQTLVRQRNDELIAANGRLEKEIEVRRRAEESLHVALDAASMGSWDIDLTTGFMGRSSRFEEILGIDGHASGLRIETMLEYFIDEDRADVLAAFNAAKMHERLDIEKRVRRVNDGATRWVHMTGRTYYREGTPVRIAGIVSDVTDRRLMDAQLRHAQKMEAIGQLTGGVAHDFNNLLMVIGGSLELLDGRIPNDPRTQRHLDAAKLGVTRGQKLNEQLLAFSRHQDLRVEPVCVHDRLETIRVLLDHAIGETIEVDIRDSPDRPHCLTDPHQLETAILNLAINARDAMPNGGRLTLSIHSQHISALPRESLDIKSGNYIVIEVSDTGSGMPPEVVERVFEPFFTTKGVGHGTGLGLSQVYGFAKQSGGFVSIDSVLDRGTTVRIHLPCVDAPLVAAEMAVERQESAKNQGTVLLIEDDENVRDVTRSMLEELGYTVKSASNAQIALDLLRDDVAVDLIFSDVIMPGGMNGAQLAKLIQAEYPTIPIVLCSGYTAQHLSAELSLSDIRCLRKPYSITELADAATAAMRRTIK